VTLLGPQPAQADVRTDEDWGLMVRHTVRWPDGSPGGIGGYGSGHASTTRGHVRGIHLGVGGRGYDEGDGEGCGRG